MLLLCGLACLELGCLRSGFYSGVPDTGAVVADAGASDSTVADATGQDAADAASEDAASADAASEDTATADAAIEDAATADAAIEDATVLPGFTRTDIVPRPTPQAWGAIYFSLSPDRQTLVLAGDFASEDVVELWSMRPDGSGLVLLTPFESGQRLADWWARDQGFPDYAITADSQRVAYMVWTATSTELWVVNLDGTGRRKLSPDWVGGDGVCDDNNMSPPFVLTPDGTRAVFGFDWGTRTTVHVAHLDSGQVDILHSTTTGYCNQLLMTPDGSQAVVALWGDPLVAIDLVTGASVPLSSNEAWEVKLTADGSHAIYWGDDATAGKGELFAAPLDGSGHQRISHDLPAGEVWNFRVAPIGDRVIYVANPFGGLDYNVYSVLSDGTGLAVLNAPVPPIGYIVDGMRMPASQIFSPDGSKFLYQAALDNDSDTIDLYSVNLDGTGLAKVNGPMVSGGQTRIGGFAVAPDNLRVVFAADAEIDERWTVYVADMDGQNRQRIGPFLADGSYPYEVDLLPDNQSVLVLHGSYASGSLYAVGYDGSNLRLVDRPEDEPCLYANHYDPLLIGNQLLHLVLVPEGNCQLQSVDLVTGERRTLSPTFIGWGSALTPAYLQFTPDNQRAIWRQAALAGGSTQGVSVSPIDASGLIELSDPASASAIAAMQLVGDGQHLLFAVTTASRVASLYAVALAGGAPALLSDRLACSSFPTCFAPTPDSSRVVLLERDPLTSFMHIAAVPMAGGARTVLSNWSMTSNNLPLFRIAPDSASVAYLIDDSVAWRGRMYAAPIDGSAAPVRLDEGLAPYGMSMDAATFVFVPDGQQLLYLERPASPELNRLSRINVDGSNRQLLDTSAVADNSLSSLLGLTGDGASVVYLASGSSGTLIASSDVAGTASRVLATATGSSVVLAGERAVFEADDDGDGQRELRSVRLDGTNPALLVDELGPARRFYRWIVAPNQQGVAVLIDNESATAADLHWAAIDGSALLQVSGPLRPGGAIQPDFAIAATAGAVYYRADDRERFVYQLFEAPIDGSGPVRLHGELPAGASIFGFALAPDDRHLYFLSNEAGAGAPRVYLVAR